MIRIKGLGSSKGRITFKLLQLQLIRSFVGEGITKKKMTLKLKYFHIVSQLYFPEKKLKGSPYKYVNEPNPLKIKIIWAGKVESV